MMKKIVRPALVCSVLLAGAAQAQQAQNPLQGDANAGRQVAMRSCTNCHAIDATTPARNDAAPTFVSIARNPDRTRAYVTGWLMNPHPPMPNVNLTTREIADVAAFIESLRQ